jgi:hypothetical protein
LTEAPTSKPGGRKFTGADEKGPMRVRVERAHGSDPNYTGPKDPLHTKDHIHLDRRKNVNSGKWQSSDKTELPYPFDD